MNDLNLKIALTIAGSDPSGGAGFQADVRTFQSMGVYGLSVPSVLTAQNTEGVYSIHEVPAPFMEEQLDVLLKDITPDALKTGMLYCTDTVAAVARKIEQYSLKNLVIDPVAVSSTGVMLIEEKGLDAIRSDLFPLSKVITPNIYEAAVFTGKEIESKEDMKEAAAKLRESGPDAVIITGGHLEEKAEDMLFDGEEFTFFENEMLEGEYHGTGCVFSAALTAGLARGDSLKEAFLKAKQFTFSAMKNALSAGRGMKVLGI
jgi:hydroxymethylpyrimidine/phosphomethylpyrimidine kinase